jgi:hypothetical protein
MIDVRSRGKNDQSLDDIQSLLSCGIACCGAIPSDYFLLYHPNALEVGHTLPFEACVNSFTLADELFLEQRR